MRRNARQGKANRLTPSAPESLEKRELMSSSGLYTSLPDLTIRGTAAPVAAYRGTMTVSVEIDNIGANTYPDFNQAQGAPSTADAPYAVVSVFMGTSPHWPTRAIKIAEFETPEVVQKSLVIEDVEIAIPPRTRRFMPLNSDKMYLFFRVDLPKNYALPDYDYTNNLDRRGVPVELIPNLPDLYAIGLDVPAVMQPGDVIRPTIQVTNLGAADPSEQGSFQVFLVASDDLTFGPGDVILYGPDGVDPRPWTLDSLPPLSAVPMARTVLGDATINTPANIVTLEADAPVVLPQLPSSYYIGVVVDPTNQIREISERRQAYDSAINPIALVSVDGAVPPANIVRDVEPTGSEFPIPPFGPISPLYRDFIAPITDPESEDPFGPALTIYQPTPVEMTPRLFKRDRQRALFGLMHQGRI